MTNRITEVPAEPGDDMINIDPVRRNVTRWLLRCLALVGPFYVAVSLLQAFSRAGFDPAIHEWSLLALGPFGWIQTTNLIITGVLIIAGAFGLSRSLPTKERGRRVAANLLGGYGISCLAAGVFPADPAYGFPVGAPAGPQTMPSVHALLHLVFGGLGFLCLIITCFVLTRIAVRHRRIRAAWISVIVGVLFSCSFAGIATAAGNPTINLAFTGAIILSFGWLTALSVVLRRQLDRG